MTATARESGALKPIDTRSRRIADGGVRFLVREATALREKDAARERIIAALDADAPERCGTVPPAERLQPPSFDPFGPVAPALDLGPVSEGYRGVLNKFPVLDDHWLLVTESWEPQVHPLDARAFRAASVALADHDALVFYNGGARAGASQPHRHLQVVPRALCPELGALPIEALMEGDPGDTVAASPRLPFAHAWVATPTDPEAKLELWHACLAHTGLRVPTGPSDRAPVGAYNLLMTRRWTLLVPRRVEHVNGISFNALGFAGALFGRTAADVQTIEAAGPMSMLCRAAGTASGE